jgi:hypothetical protein
MERLLELLRDGHARTFELLALELNTDVADVRRQIEYLENMGIIKKVSLQVKGCEGCASCSGKDKNGQTPCKGCLPDDGFKNMGSMWEVVSK